MTQQAWLDDKRAKADATVTAAQIERAALDIPIPGPITPPPPPPPPPPSATQTQTYTVNPAEVPGPGRGMQDSYETYWTGHALGAPWNVTPGERAIRRVIGLPVTEGNLSAAFLADLDKDGANWIRNGVCADLRFVYAQNPGWPEPSFAAMLRHAAQLRPFLNKYSHVINLLELGMLGPWGEGHSITAAGWTDPFDNGSAWPQTLQLVRAWMASTVRLVSVRYAWQLQWLAGQLTAAELMRLAHNNDQFLAGYLNEPDHGGTFRGSWDWPHQQIDDQKTWLAAFLDTHHFRAESDWPKDGTFGEYARAHIDDDGPERYNATTWRDIRGLLRLTFDDAKIAEIERRMGYRLYLQKFTYPTSAQRGQAISLIFDVVNEGYARPSHSRPVYVTFNGVPSLLAGIDTDAQAWGPGGSTRTVRATCVVPANATSGPLAMWLPDKAASLQQDPRYSIRLANAGMWDPTTGRNNLGATVTVA